MKVWEWAGIVLATPGSVVRLASVAKHVIDCATRPGTSQGHHLEYSILAIHESKSCKHVSLGTEESEFYATSFMPLCFEQFQLLLFPL